MTKLDFNKVSYDEGRRMLHSAVAGPFMKTAAGGSWTDIADAGRKAWDWVSQKGHQVGDAAQHYGGQALDAAKHYGGEAADAAKHYGGSAWDSVSPYLHQGKEWLEKNYADPNVRPWLNIGGGAALGGALGLGSSLFQDKDQRSPISRALAGALLGGMGGGGVELLQHGIPAMKDDDAYARKATAKATIEDEVSKANRVARPGSTPLSSASDHKDIEKQLGTPLSAGASWHAAAGNEKVPEVWDLAKQTGRTIFDPTLNALSGDGSTHDKAMAAAQWGTASLPMLRHLPHHDPGPGAGRIGRTINRIVTAPGRAYQHYANDAPMSLMEAAEKGRGEFANPEAAAQMRNAREAYSEMGRQYSDAGNVIANNGGPRTYVDPHYRPATDEAAFLRDIAHHGSLNQAVQHARTAEYPANVGAPPPPQTTWAQLFGMPQPTPPGGGMERVTLNPPSANGLQNPAAGITPELLRRGYVRENGAPVRPGTPAPKVNPKTNVTEFQRPRLGRSAAASAALFAGLPMAEQGMYALMGQPSPLQDQLARESLQRYQEAQKALQP